MNAIVNIRKYLLTILIFLIGTIININFYILFIFIIISIIFDLSLIKSSKEIELFLKYPSNSDIVQSSISRSHAFLIQITAAIICTAIPILISYLLGGGVWQQVSSMFVLFISGLAGSYCGFRVVRADVPTALLLSSLDKLPDIFTIIEAFSPKVTRISSATLRFIFGLFSIFLFVKASSGNLYQYSPFLSISIMIFLASLCQVGIVLIVQGLLSLRWIGFVDN